MDNITIFLSRYEAKLISSFFSTIIACEFDMHNIFIGQLAKVMST